jgi:hypothetical protein
MRPTAVLAVLSGSLPLLAQATLPEPGSPAATALFAKACGRMLATSGGSFRTAETQDNAVMRNAGFAMPGGGDIDVDGGWHGDTVFARCGEGDEVVRHHGRMVAKDAGTWKLRSGKLPSGTPVPFLASPPLLFTLLHDLPPAQAPIRSVEATGQADKPQVILGLTLQGQAATDLALSGALPAVSGGLGGIQMFGGGGAALPQPDYTVDLALTVDPESGDVLRLRARVYERNEMLRNMRIQFGGPGGAGGNDAPPAGGDEVTDAEPAADTELVYKKGLPDRRLAKDVSLMYYRVDFQNLGAGNLPELDAKAKSLLGM